MRRLSPNSRKIEVKDYPSELLSFRMLRAMGYELANLHLGTGNRHTALEEDFSGRDDDWLLTSAKKAAKFVVREYNDWCKG